MPSRSLSRLAMERLIRLGLRGLPDTPEGYDALIRSSNHNTVPRLPHLRVAPSLLTLEGMPAFVFGAGSDADQPTLLYLHGGSYFDNPILFHYEAAAALAAKSGWRVLLPLYGKIPQYSWREDFPPLQTLLTQLTDRLPVEKVGLLGDSAGGGLVAGLLLERIREGLALPGKCLLYSPWLDATVSNPESEAIAPRDPMLAAWRLRICGKYWAGKDDPRIPPVSPLFGDPAGFPPTLLFTGTSELFCPDVQAFSARLEAAGVPQRLITGEDQFHDYPLYPTAEGEAARAESVRFLKEGF